VGPAAVLHSVGGVGHDQVETVRAVDGTCLGDIDVGDAETLHLTRLVLRFGGGDGGLEAASEDPLLSAQRRGVGPVLQAFAFEVGAQERGVGIEVPFVDVGARGVV